MYKKFNFVFAIVVLTIFCFACQNGQNKKYKSLTNKNVFGKWSNTLMHMKFKSYRNTNKDSVLNVTKENWYSILKIMPIETTFTNNGNYKSEYFDANGKLIHNVSGNFWFSNDSVILNQQIPNKDVNKYKTKIWENKISFETTIDFDGDGKKDDFYYGEQEKIN